jgi:hypothetical protein
MFANFKTGDTENTLIQLYITTNSLPIIAITLTPYGIENKIKRNLFDIQNNDSYYFGAQNFTLKMTGIPRIIIIMRVKWLLYEHLFILRRYVKCFSQITCMPDRMSKKHITLIYLVSKLGHQTCTSLHYIS